MDIDAILKTYYKNDYGALYNGPSVSFVYPQKLIRARELYGSVEVPLSYNSQTEEDFQLWQALANKLQEMKAEAPRDLEFKMRFVLPTTVPPTDQEPQGLFYVSLGVSKHYGRDEHGVGDGRDMVDAMYYVDETGMALLRDGLQSKRKPISGYCDYNFCQKLERGVLNNEELSLLIDGELILK